MCPASLPITGFTTELTASAAQRQQTYRKALHYIYSYDTIVDDDAGTGYSRCGREARDFHHNKRRCEEGLREANVRLFQYHQRYFRVPYNAVQDSNETRRRSRHIASIDHARPVKAVA